MYIHIYTHTQPHMHTQSYPHRHPHSLTTCTIIRTHLNTAINDLYRHLQTRIHIHVMLLSGLPGKTIIITITYAVVLHAAIFHQGKEPLFFQERSAATFRVDILSRFDSVMWFANHICHA